MSCYSVFTFPLNTNWSFLSDSSQTLTQFHFNILSPMSHPTALAAKCVLFHSYNVIIYLCFENSINNWIFKNISIVLLIQLWWVLHVKWANVSDSPELVLGFKAEFRDQSVKKPPENCRSLGKGNTVATPGPKCRAPSRLRSRPRSQRPKGSKKCQGPLCPTAVIAEKTTPLGRCPLWNYPETVN